MQEPTTPEGDEKHKTAEGSASQQSARHGSFFDYVARKVHEVQGNATNQIVGLIAHEDLAAKFSQPINSELAREYLKGKTLLESREAQGKAESDLSGLSREQQASILAYQKVHLDLPASIPLVDRDALMRQVEHNIEIKARVSKGETVQIPPPHPAASRELKEVQPVSPVRQPDKKAPPKPNEPVTRELKSQRQEESPRVERSAFNKISADKSGIDKSGVDKPGTNKSSSDKPAYTESTSDRISSNRTAAERSETPPSVRPVPHPELHPELPKISASPLLSERKDSPEWLQQRLQTFTLRPATVTAHQTDEAVARIIDKLVKTPLLQVKANIAQAPTTQIAQATISSPVQRSETLRWAQVVSRLNILCDRSALVKENRARQLETPFRRPTFTDTDNHSPTRLRLVQLTVANKGIPLGRHFDKREIILTLKQFNQTFCKTDPPVHRPEQVTPQQLASQQKLAPLRLVRTFSGQAASSVLTLILTEKSRPDKDLPATSEPKPSNSSAANFVEFNAHTSAQVHSQAQPQAQPHAELKSEFHSSSESVSELETESESKSESESESESAPASASASESKSPGKRSTYSPTSTSYVVRGFMPDKRYITGGELAVVAIMALASAARVRPGENATETGLGLVGRQYVLVDEEAWTEPNYKVPPVEGENVAEKSKIDEKFKKDDKTSQPQDSVSHPAKVRIERKILTRPQILIESHDDLAEMAGILFNDTRLGHLIADLNSNAIIQNITQGARVVRLTTRQRISLPVYQDILQYDVHLAQADSLKLITIVEETALDRELLENGLSRIIGLHSPNRDPLEPDENQQ